MPQFASRPAPPLGPTTTISPPGTHGIHTFVLDTSDATLCGWLGQALQQHGTLVGQDATPDGFADVIGIQHPTVVFLRFDGTGIARAGRLATHISGLFPSLPLIAIGDARNAGATLAALRAGVKDFIDTSADPGAVTEVVTRLLAGVRQAIPTRRGDVVAVLGSRAGVGTSTFAANLAARVRRITAKETLLLDLGIPVRDGALYANVAPDFHFVEAVRNAQRFDQVFIETAIAHHPNGMAVLPLPATLAELREISPTEALGLLANLRAYFDLQVIDLGGFSNLDFMAQLIKLADTVLIVAEQSVASIVSGAELLQELEKRDVDRSGVGLIVNGFDARIGVDAEQVAQRLECKLSGVLPERREVLLSAMNSGVLLADSYTDDPYIRALAQIAGRLGYGTSATPDQGVLARLRASLPRLARLAAKGGRR